MKQLELTIHNKTGLHARPAKELVNLAKTFEAKISIHYGKKKANAKSMISVLTLGVKPAGQIQITIDGSDEDAASIAITDAINSGLGESIEPETTTAEPAKEEAKDESKAESTAANDQPAKAEVAKPNTIIGNIASSGIAIGPVQILKRAQIEQLSDQFSDVDTEKQALKNAIDSACEAIKKAQVALTERTSKEEGEIFAAHLELVQDPELLEAVHERIANKQSAPIAWNQEVDERVKTLAASPNELLAARSADLKDVGQRVLQYLTGAADDQSSDASGETAAQPVILVAEELLPSDTADLTPETVLGIATVHGGPNAHSAIIARALGIPALVGAGPEILNLKDDQMVILDADNASSPNGTSGTLYTKPSKEELASAAERQSQQAGLQAAAQAQATQKAITLDGHHVEIAANVANKADTEKAIGHGAEGIGLLRTEFLFRDQKESPSRDFQTKAYGDILDLMPNDHIVIRTLDVGGDKPLPYIPVEPELNPFLGERGIRLCLNRPEILRTQLEALYAAAPKGKLRVMFPMVGQIHEWRAARQIAAEAQKAVNGPDIELGIMIELPSAAVMAPAFAQEVDFFSIGTNDLTQYTLGIDRMHPTLAKQADGLNPAVLKLIDLTVQAAKAEGKWVGVCGELAADPQAVPILLGLGVNELSMSPNAIPATKMQIRQLNLKQAQALAQKALVAKTAADVRQLVTDNQEALSPAPSST